MKAILGGILVAAVIAVAAAFVLDTGVQRTSEERYATGAVRL